MPTELQSSISDRAAFYQYSANALCDMRSSAAPILFERIIGNPDYHSWQLAGMLSALYVTDKIDGLLAKKCTALVTEIPEEQHQEILGNDLLEAIKTGGRKDDLADKKLTHSIFGAMAISEFSNGNIAYSSVIAGADAVMHIRDTYVGKKRDRAAKDGIKSDARNLGKYKQLLLVTASVLAVSPLTRKSKKETDTWSPGRSLVTANIVGGAIMSIISGVDQVRSLRDKSTN